MDGSWKNFTLNLSWLPKEDKNNQKKFKDSKTECKKLNLIRFLIGLKTNLIKLIRYLIWKQMIYNNSINFSTFLINHSLSEAKGFMEETIL